MKRKVSITVEPRGLRVEAQRGEHLLSILANAGSPVNSYCGGRGTCGKCRVRISGTVPVPSVLDRNHLSEDELTAGIRLACSVIPSGGEIVECTESAAGASHKLQLNQISFPTDPWRKEGEKCAVLAVDLGTTNIVGHLVDPYTGRVLASSGRENSQAIYGADVMSRLTYASHNGSKGRETLRRCAHSDIESLVQEVAPWRGITDVVAVMNTAMEVLLLGADPDSLGRYPCDSGINGPFHADVFFEGQHLRGAALHLPPVIGGYVGSDTVAGLLALKMFLPKPPYMLLDIGTNAEVVVVTDEKIVACSTAAGPAFEGMGIACGMRGVEGAISRVAFGQGKAAIPVIGGGPARGITGSALFSLIGELLRAGAMDPFGLLQIDKFTSGQFRRGNGGNEVLLAPDVYVSEHDLQQFLLAKAASRAAVDTLLNLTNIDPEELTAVYLAGTFASMIEPADILAAGLIPPDCAGKIRSAGNAAASGAVMMAASKRTFDHACVLAGRVRHLSLSGNRDFIDAFQSNVHF